MSAAFRSSYYHLCQPQSLTSTRLFEPVTFTWLYIYDLFNGNLNLCLILRTLKPLTSILLELSYRFFHHSSSL